MPRPVELATPFQGLDARSSAVRVRLSSVLERLHHMQLAMPADRRPRLESPTPTARA